LRRIEAVVLLKNFINIFFIPELRKKILFTFGILVIYRLGIQIPAVGVNIDALRQMIEGASGVLGKLFPYLDLFSGGGLSQCTIFALGINPYITSSIMMQMLGMTIPSLEQLLKEGDYGRKIVNQYTRYLAFGVAIFQSMGYAFWLEKSNLVLTPGWGFRLTFVFSLTICSMFVMWLGEQISLLGLGNGSSMIIFAGIVARLPIDIHKLIYQVLEGFVDWYVAAIALALFVLITSCIVFLERGERKIPVQYARRVVGQRVYGGQSTYIPFKINTPGVMPVIFASSVMAVPQFVFATLAPRFAFCEWMSRVFSYSSVTFITIDFFLIIFFSFFYTALVYNPEELADNIKKSGGFIPGIRPGKKTAEFFNYILTRIGLIGAIYLGLLAITPTIIGQVFGVGLLSLGGTSMLIMVGVGLETAAQIESYLIEHRYEGFLSSGRMHGRSSR
jgi:preprotein translocase subunit SecY